MVNSKKKVCVHYVAIVPLIANVNFINPPLRTASNSNVIFARSSTHNYSYVKSKKYNAAVRNIFFKFKLRSGHGLVASMGNQKKGNTRKVENQKY